MVRYEVEERTATVFIRRLRSLRLPHLLSLARWLANEKERRLRKLAALAKAGCGLTIRDGSLVVEYSFCRTYLGHVSEAVNALLTRINEKYAKTVTSTV